MGPAPPLFPICEGLVWRRSAGTSSGAGLLVCCTGLLAEDGCAPQFQVQPLLPKLLAASLLSFWLNPRCALTQKISPARPHSAQDRLDCVLVLTASEVRCYHFKGVEDPAALSRKDILISIPLAEDAVYGNLDVVARHVAVVAAAHEVVAFPFGPLGLLPFPLHSATCAAWHTWRSAHSDWPR